MTSLGLVFSPYGLVEAASLGLLVNGLGRIALALVVLVSGVGKALDLPGTRQAMTDFGLPHRWVRLFALALPGMEILTSFGLLIDSSSRLAGCSLGVLGLLFCAGIWNLLQQDRTPPCHCFGAVHSAPVGRATLVRAALLALAAFATALLPTFPLTTSGERVAIAVLFLALCGALLSAYLLWQRVQNPHRFTRLEVGQRIPHTPLLSGESLQTLLAKHPRTLLVLTSAQCAPCRELKGQLKSWKVSLSTTLPILELHPPASDSDSSTAFLADLEISEESFRGFRSPTPGALLVDKQGTLLSPPVSGPEQIEALIRATISGSLWDDESNR